MILNPSFNENEPIIISPDETLDYFLRTDTVVLVLENYKIEIKGNGLYCYVTTSRIQNYNAAGGFYSWTMSWNEFNYGWIQIFILLAIWGIDWNLHTTRRCGTTVVNVRYIICQKSHTSEPTYVMNAGSVYLITRHHHCLRWSISMLKSLIKDQPLCG